MDESLYSKEIINAYMNDNLFFKDKLLKKYYDEDKLKEFRKRLISVYPKKDLENMVYGYVTDMIRDIVYDIIGKLTVHLKDSGDLILTGGDAVNYYLLLDSRIVTSDIDTKFIPKFKVDKKFFTKLQAVKLLLWDKLGEISQKFGSKIKQRLSSKNKLARFLGIGFPSNGPYVTRRYTLKQKKKESQTNKPALENVLIDVEIFALDLKINYFSPKDKKVVKHNLGGILDIAFMRPGEFGYEVGETKNSAGILFRNNQGKLIHNKNITIAKRRFLVEDIYLMQALGLRPHKKQKDRQRMSRLLKTYQELRSIKSIGSISSLFKRYQKSPVAKTVKKSIQTDGKVSISKALKVNPLKYQDYTTKPSSEKLKKITYASNEKLKGYKETQGNMRFNIQSGRWVKNNSNSYVKNEYKYRYNSKNNKKLNLPNKFQLYGYKESRDKNYPKGIFNKSSLIPYVGLKK
jgi:hypothetical protein